jgi:hypothetical protein
MLDHDEDPEAFHAALEREAWRIARTGQPSDAGQLVLRSIAASIAATMPEASSEVQTSAVGKALLLFAKSEWDAAANGLAAVLLFGTDKLVTADVMAGGNVLAMPERTMTAEAMRPDVVTPEVIAKLRTAFQRTGMTADQAAQAADLFVGLEVKLDRILARIAEMEGDRKLPA